MPKSGRTAATALAFALALALAPAARATAENLFTKVDERSAGLDPAERRIRPERARVVLLDTYGLETLLTLAPDERSAPRGSDRVEILLPTPDGRSLRLRVVDSPIMEPALAAKFPEIRTFLLVDPADPAVAGRGDWTPHGFHAVVRTPRGRIYVDPYRPGDVEHYQVYRRADLAPPEEGFRCATAAEPIAPPDDRPGETPLAAIDLRTYRTAVAATGEYTIFHGGTVPAGMAAIVTAMNRVNEVYEHDVAIRMILVADNDLVVYTNPATDPYTNNSGPTMLGQNQANLDAVIGNANYDMGHVFSTGGGGVASLSVPCVTGSKARGVTGLSNPTGDPFYIDYVAHEMGHQWSGRHSFNGNAGACSGGNRDASSAYEPGSGSTIMAYAGICGSQNLQLNSDAYFHLVNLLQIQSYSRNGNGNGCAAIVPTGNLEPIVDAGADYTIPISTPFELFGSGSDPDGTIVGFGWEQYDLGPAGHPNTPSGNAPIFRSFDPVATPWRTFPKLEDLLDGTPTIGEILPTYARVMHFRLSARDDGTPAGANDWDDNVVTVVDSAGPFLVLSPDGPPDSWSGPGPHAVTWDEAGTASAPVSCATVDILLSTDAGQTFDVELAVNVANDGS
ncbi:MAG TPA: zinc-dependent metalloprotease family protein, partial [Thermoanaerobaculia bacterium]|nr:zinc-dependent metalloprotease family protein [Thermoanaerobaculia bacterium]